MCGPIFKSIEELDLLLHERCLHEEEMLVGAAARPHQYTHILRVGQNRIYTPYMTVYMVISLPKLPYVNRIYMVLPTLHILHGYARTCTH